MPSSTREPHSAAVGSWTPPDHQSSAEAGTVTGSASTTTHEMTCQPGIARVTDAPST